MKKITAACFIIAIGIFSFLPLSFASAQGYCPSINSGNYLQCCPAREIADSTQTNDQNVRCQEYRQDLRCATNPNDPFCIPIRGGTQGTNPFDTTNNGSTAGSIASPGAASPELAACSAIRFKSALDILIWLKCIIVAAIIPLIFSLAFVFFLWGVFRFMTADTPEKKKTSQRLIWWGLIGLFVMVSVWGIIKILGTTLGIESTVPLLQTEYLK